MNSPDLSCSAGGCATGRNVRRTALGIMAGAGAVLPLLVRREDWASAWLAVAVTALFAASVWLLFSSLTQQLPAQNVLAAAALVGIAGSAAHALSIRTGFPFGRLLVNPVAGSQLPGGVPVWMPLAWIVIVFSARGTAQLLLYSKRQSPRYGCGLLALSAGLAAWLWAGFDLFATHGGHCWHRADQSWHWQGIALPNLSGCFLTVAVNLALAMPLLINKRPVQTVPGPWPMVTWSGLSLAFMAGSLSLATAAAVAVLGAPVMVVTMLAFQQHRRTVADCGGLRGQE